jgi:EAL domain-containing protein (putative c-di-GMP-specific phosphodiesterase class I)
VLQGYHVARPMPADRFGEWVTEWENGLAELSA